MNPRNLAVVARVLLVDDDDGIRSAVRRALEAQTHQVDEADSGAAALATLARGTPDVIVLDVGLPDQSGLEVLSELRRRNPALPVILLTARAEEADRVLGLDLGADDYLTKPFSVRELMARIRAVLRRAGHAADTPDRLQFGDMEIRVAEREVVLAGEVVGTTPKEFELLVFLARHPRAVFSREELLREVWSSSAAWQDQATVTEHVRRLRRKLESDPENPRWLVTARGVGYRFEP